MTANASRLTLPHTLLAIAVMAVWGSNFVAVKHVLPQLPPLTLATLRFFAVFFPGVLFLKRPPVAWRNLAAYGAFIGAGQFGCMMTALNGQITPGLASLMMQSQVFITIGLSVAMTGERVARAQILGLMLAIAGLATIGFNSAGSVTALGFVLIGGGASSWAIGNIVARSAGRVDMLNYVIWSGIFAAVPLLALALLVEGPAKMASDIGHADAVAWVVVAWQVIGNTMFGYSVWGWLLARYPAATVAPMALLIPIFGLGASAFFLGEPLQPWKLIAAALVIGGVAVGVIAGRKPAAPATGTLLTVE